MKRRVLSLLLCLALALSLTGTALAVTTENPDWDDPMYLLEREEEPAADEAQPRAVLLEGTTFVSHFTGNTYNVPSEVVSEGIDVSRFQKDIDWEAVAEDGVEFVIIRAGYRGNNSGALTVDSYFEQNIRGALAVGLKVGVYFFTEAVTPEEAAEEAEFLVSLIKDYNVQLPLFYDLEFGNEAWRLDAAYNALPIEGDTRSQFLEGLCNAFTDRCTELGYTSMVYSNKTMLTSYMSADNLHAPIWLAQYNTTPTYYGDYKFWQYSSAGTVAGIEGRVDVNFCFDRSYLTCNGTTDSTESGPSQLGIFPTGYPSGNFTPRAFDLTGSISSNYPIMKLTCSVRKLDGTVVQSASDTPYRKFYRLMSSKLDNAMTFGTLTSGYYYLQYTAADASGQEATWNSAIFAVPGCQVFGDVPQNAWYYWRVYLAADKNLINGMDDPATGERIFQPDGSLTRAQAVKILYQQAGQPTRGQSHPFTDATAGWYQDALGWAYQAGIITGTGENTFSPDDPVTRQDFAVLLYRSKGSPAFSGAGLADYGDVSSVASYALPGLSWCVSQGIITSASTEAKLLAPRERCTRAQAVTMLLNEMGY